ncbi:substrate-binding domain-containing protein [Mesorhizobium sp. INR15]|uniref:substrate-binding domain-containing protein n=1 Tax=Mesorhizobium sp. INR15 TaxID=2654248 RepID=UPI0018968D2B|nr:substrate-binding domain-containing protein [Mesorhizobium sp. INR15]QPC95896.1 molybdate transporter substrate-binding protein [Mesorhizobium sp. INR15]
MRSAAPPSTILIYAAGSLRYVLPFLISAFSEMTGVQIETRHGPAGLLRERIEAGERPDIFLSANVAHSARLAEQGLALPPVVFARNTMAAVVHRDAGFTSVNFIDRLLDPIIGIATSTPSKDASGDYAWAIFRRAEKLRHGSFAILDAKAQHLVGGSDMANAAGRYDPIVAALAAGTVHVFLGYRTGLKGLAEATQGVKIVKIPANLNVVPEYGLAALKDCSLAGMAFALFIISAAGQKLLQNFGFQPVALSQGR